MLAERPFCLVLANATCFGIVIVEVVLVVEEVKAYQVPILKMKNSEIAKMRVY